MIVSKYLAFVWRAAEKHRSFYGRTPVVGSTYNPAHTNMPVKTPFWDAVVRSRQSRGIGLKTVNNV